MDVETAQIFPKQGPSYVEEPALPSPFDISLLTANLERQSPCEGHKGSQLGATISLLGSSVLRCSHDRICFPQCFLGTVSLQDMFSPPSNQSYTSRICFRWQEKSCSCPVWKWSWKSLPAYLETGTSCSSCLLALQQLLRTVSFSWRIFHGQSALQFKGP